MRAWDEENAVGAPEKQTLTTTKRKFGGPQEGAGRKKGVPNKMTRDLKEMIMGALDDAGGQKDLAAKAKTHPGPFLTLLGKVLPTQVTGANGGPIKTCDTAQLAKVDAKALDTLSATMLKIGIHIE